MKEGIGVLLLFFNKVDTTGLVLERILEAKPSVLLLAQDGAREGNSGMQEKSRRTFGRD